MKRAQRGFRALVTAVALVAGAATATTMVALDLTALTSASDAVVRGRIVSVAAHWSGDHARIFTDADLEVADVWKGSSTLKTLTATQPGGEIGEVGQRIHGVATFTVGEDVVVFLERRGPRYTITGMAQGKFRIEGSTAQTSDAADLSLLDPVTHQPVSRPALSLPVDELKKQVLAAVLKAPVEPTNPTGTQVTP
jgi:hypothetical protein